MPRFFRMLTVADAALIILATILLSQLFVKTYSSDHAKSAVITDHIGQHHEINLQRNQVLTIQGAIGASTLLVDNGRLRFTDSPCNNKVCIHTGWIKYAGEASACLPNRLSAQLARNDNGFDSINF